MKILAIDPGNELSGYLLASCSGGRIEKIIESGKIENKELLGIIRREMQGYIRPIIVIEQIENFGMPVGRTVFDTCIWIGRFIQCAKDIARYKQSGDIEYHFITRREEKLLLCRSIRAKDVNIRQALINLYARYDFRNGKGTKKDPDFFYGFKADMWSAAAVAHTFLNVGDYDTQRKDDLQC